MRYEQIIRDLPTNKKLLKDDLLVDSLKLFEDNNITIFYAPFEYINKNAKVVIVGITPGWSQMQKSFSVVKELLDENVGWDIALKEVKKMASFAGSMRTNLIAMLDEIGLNEKLNLESCKLLYGDQNHLLHSTSYLKNPVFYRSSNYSGKTPSPIRQPLWNIIEQNFVSEINEFENILIIPLGKSVKQVFSHLKNQNILKPNIVLDHFPHPSGENRHRVLQFEQSKNMLREQIANWKN